MITVLEIDVEAMQREMREPAINSHEHSDREVYFVRGDRVVGLGRTQGGSGWEGNMKILVEPLDDAAKALFEGDPVIAKLGRHGYPAYDSVSGQPVIRFTDEDPARFKDTYVVSKLYHDQGMLPRRFTVQPLTGESCKFYNQRIDRKYDFGPVGNKGRDRLFGG